MQAKLVRCASNCATFASCHRSRCALHLFITPGDGFLVVALLAGLCSLRRASAIEKRNITEKDLFNFVWIGDPQLSPDGSRVAFVRVSVNEKKEGYDTSLWVVSTAGGEEPHRLTTWNAGRLAALVAGREIYRLRAHDRKRGKARAGSALHAADDRWRCVSIYLAAERRRRSRLVAGRKNDCLHQREQSGRSGESGEEKAEGRGAKEGRCRREAKLPSQRIAGKEDEETSARATSTWSRARSIARTTKAISIQSVPRTFGRSRRRGPPTRRCSRSN